MTWKAAHFCVNCDQQLTSDERFGNSGVCVHCGHKSKSACTIVETYTRAYRRVRVASWWNIFRIGRKFKIEWKDQPDGQHTEGRWDI